jgi:DNA-binding transcriptional ArsR family regulator
MRKDRRTVNRRKPGSIDQRLVRALGHPLRVQILEELHRRDASPNELMEALESPLGNVAYHVRVLERCGCIELVGTARRRGAIEHYFRARPRSYIGHQDWRRVPATLRGEVTGAALQSFAEQVADAVEAGTLDARDDTTLAWMPVAVDETGWAQLRTVLAEALAKAQIVHDQSRARIEKSGAKLTPVVVGVAGFEAAGPQPGPKAA